MIIFASTTLLEVQKHPPADPIYTMIPLKKTKESKVHLPSLGENETSVHIIN